MAVAGIIVLCEQPAVKELKARLAAHPAVTDMETVAESCKLVAVLEVESDTVESTMSEILKWEGVLTVDLAFVSYEDELEAGKSIKCPPHIPRHGK